MNTLDALFIEAAERIVADVGIDIDTRLSALDEIHAVRRDAVFDAYGQKRRMSEADELAMLAAANGGDLNAQLKSIELGVAPDEKKEEWLARGVATGDADALYLAWLHGCKPDDRNLDKAALKGNKRALWEIASRSRNSLGRRNQKRMKKCCQRIVNAANSAE